MEDPRIILDILSALEAALGMLFGGSPPAWVQYTLSIAVAGLGLLSALWAGLWLCARVGELWTNHLSPLLVDRERRRHLLRRKRFAEHCAHEVRRLNRLEVWSDHRYADLEGEVEAESRVPNLLRFARARGVRREPSLARALSHSRERIVLLEGEPGAGKTVALRHVALDYCERAANDRSGRLPIAIYVNLREARRASGEQVDSGFVRRIVTDALTRVNDRDVTSYVEQRLDEGMQAGEWVFLFDSFDEIPEVLGATEHDGVVQQYTEAIADFLSGMNICRAVVASRYFRGPNTASWTKFRVVPLSVARQQRLVRQAELNSQAEALLLSELASGAESLRALASNPMFLGMLCEHVRQTGALPASSHAVFENFVSDRLTRDAMRLSQRFGVTVEEVREVAERIAFEMSASTSFGLSPRRRELEGLAGGGPSSVAVILDALEFIRIARGESDQQVSADAERTFSFAHRRIQEYFATCVLLREPARVSPAALVKDARWREATVAMIATRPVGELPQLEVPLSQILLAYAGPPAPFAWPPGALHAASIVQDGFSAQPEGPPEKITRLFEPVVSDANRRGTVLDRKWAVEVCGCVSRDVQLQVVSAALDSPSAWLYETATQRLARIANPPDRVQQAIREEMAKEYMEGKTWLRRRTTEAQLMRQSSASTLLRSHRLLLSAPIVDGFAHTLFLVIIASHASLSVLLSFAVFSLAAPYAFYRIDRAMARILRGQNVARAGLFDLLWAIGSPRLLGFPALVNVSPEVVLLSVYLLALLPSLFASARSGRWIHPLLIPFLPALWFVEAIRGLSSAAQLKSDDAWVAAGLTSLLAVFAGASTLGGLALRHVCGFEGNLVSLSLRAAAVLVVGTVIWLVVRHVARLWRDRARYRQLELERECSSAFLERAFQELHTEYYRTALVRSLRSASDLGSAWAEMPAIARLAVDKEVGLRGDVSDELFQLLEIIGRRAPTDGLGVPGGSSVAESASG